MAALSPSNQSPPTKMPRRWARKCERYCCLGLTYFPLLFVYGMTTWAVWVETYIGFQAKDSIWIGHFTSFLGALLYILLNWSYTAAVFTDPGSTSTTSNGYSALPTHTPSTVTSFTVKSTGELRFCKKCQLRKPDRAHHCSTCGRCVLKMDHHCPWLATCVGLRNYKFFLLFLIYTSLFCFLCAAVAGSWMWYEVMNDTNYGESIMPIHYVLLSVLGAIIGLVLGGFTLWHILLAAKNQTTIESLEKIRYLNPFKRNMQLRHIAQHQGRNESEQGYGQQLMDMQTNALPGITRPEEGEEYVPQPGAPVRQTYEEMERIRARERYEDYLDEQDSKNMPHAFDLGWRQNFVQIFGSNRILWPVPISSSVGNGWTWEPSPKWLEAQESIRAERDAQAQRERDAGWGVPQSFDGFHDAPHGAGRHYVTNDYSSRGARIPSKADRILGRDPSQFADAPEGRMHSMRVGDRNFYDEHDYDTSDEDGGV